MKKIKLDVISKNAAKGRGVLRFDFEAKPAELNPYICFQGEDADGVQYLCGACNAVLLDKIKIGQFLGAVICCPNCKSHVLIRGI